VNQEGIPDRVEAVIHHVRGWAVAYSQDIRSRVTQAVANGMSRRAAAARFAVGASSAIRWAARAAREGTAAGRTPGRPRGKGRLSDHLAFLTAAVEAAPGLTVPEPAARRLAAERGVTAHPSSPSRLLRRAGITYKKTAHGRGVRARRRRRAAAAAVDRAPSAPHAPRAGPAGLSR
jgi:transposase